MIEIEQKVSKLDQEMPQPWPQINPFYREEETNNTNVFSDFFENKCLHAHWKHHQWAPSQIVLEKISNVDCINKQMY